jgi:hypothetical protein
MNRLLYEFVIRDRDNEIMSPVPPRLAKIDLCLEFADSFLLANDKRWNIWNFTSTNIDYTHV